MARADSAGSGLSGRMSSSAWWVLTTEVTRGCTSAHITESFSVSSANRRRRVGRGGVYAAACRAPASTSAHTDAATTAAVVGIGLERSVIRFLYRRPLESLLATWGVSLVLQQLFKLTFGSNNVQVSSPTYLSGNWTFQDIIFGWNRVFVIGFAAFIVVGVWLVLTKTPLGLLIRAVMQNRSMASCMGIRTERVNMLTFGLGSGLAGLAGAFLSQIGNVGPTLGQNYIIDSFMVVVTGGVGSIVGRWCQACEQRVARRCELHGHARKPASREPCSTKLCTLWGNESLQVEGITML